MKRMTLSEMAQINGGMIRSTTLTGMRLVKES